MSKERDMMDVLLYAAAPLSIQKELDEYNNADPDITLSPKAKKQIMRRLKREIKYHERHKTYRPAVEWLKRAAVIVLVVMSVGFAGIISVEASRDSLYDFIVEWYENSIFFKYTFDDDGIPSEILDYREPTVDGFARYEVSKSQYRYNLEFERDGTVITYHQNPLSHYAFKLADNYSEIREVTVNGCEGVVTTYVSGGELHMMIMWHDGEYLYRLSGCADDVDEALLMSIAETIS